jgi:hypothetical protein
MMYLIIPCLILALVCASSARAETDVFSPANRLSRPVKAFAPLLGKRFVAKCRMGYCQWLRLENARLIGRSTRGELYEITTRRWGSGPHAEYKGRVRLKDRGKQTTYVFCSKTTPAYMGVYNGKKEGGRIFPGTGSVAGVSETVYVLYWAACHRTATTEAGLDTELGKRLDYKLSNPNGLGRTVEDFDFESPEDVLKS